ncbi:MAG TPA: sigma-70 family RNA polymerase sigma factor [Leptospiraceae bacterium]|nr:sigma-70 family RNA polymerase sigma factor [Leptospiraceae bacterium]HNM05297.1 sigma-70 family RNA polymerase sigma factor [Leptospiraceae bacterium]HNN06545.1 sigma-70 family RNA polymerase sigma factor [Leptospiraceae bacterium]
MKETQKECWDDWMKSAQSGDSPAYSRLLHEISFELSFYLARRVFEESDREDVLQEILIGIHKARHTYDPKKSFVSWMYAIANYKVIDYIRKKKKSADSSAEFTDETVFPEEITEDGTEEKMNLLKKAVSELPEKQRKTIELMKFKGLSLERTSEILGISVSAVKVNSHRAMKAVRNRLKK